MRDSAFQGHSDPVRVLGRALESHARRKLDAALAIGALELLGDGLVFVGDEPVQSFDDGDLGSPRTPHRCEFNADHATTENNRAGGNVVESDCLFGCQDSPTDVQTGKCLRVRPGREDHVFTRESCLADLDGGGGGERSETVEGRDSASLEKAL